MNLPILHTDRGFFALLELDQPGEMAARLGISLTEGQNKEVFQTLEQQIIIATTPHVSALVLEPTVSLPAWFSTPLQFPKNAPLPRLVVRLDTVPSDDKTFTGVPQLTASWGAEETANNYAVALVELHYHPSDADALDKKHFVAEVADSCHRQEIALILKLIITKVPTDDPKALSPEAAQLLAIQEFRSMVDAFALQVPEDVLATATLTAELDVPWLVTHDVNEPLGFPQFQAKLQQGLENGAKGYLAGTVLWSDIFGMRRADQAPDREAIEKWITTQLSDRVATLSRMVAETVSV